jgi:hypothetical protein
MTGTTASLVRVGTGFLGLVSLGWFLTGYAAPPAQEGVPTDWSHQHLVFSRPATPEQAERVARDPRYWQQWYRQNIARVLMPDTDNPAPFDLSHVRASKSKMQSDWSEDLGSGASVGAGNFPAKYAFQVTQANCANQTTPDYVVFSTGLLGSSTQASLIAYDNLYSGCTGTVPQSYWAYNTGGQILTSPVVSGDGTQVAFVQTNASLEGTLVLLKFAPGGTIGAPVSPTVVGSVPYRTCTAPCMTTITLKTSASVDVDDRTSSAFADYTHDIIWVGSAVGWLHEISGVFRGHPAEVFTGGFPKQVNPGNPNTLSSPVYDFASGNVFVGDYGGFFYRVNASTGATTQSGQLDHGTGIVAGPIVDSTSEKVYVFASSDGSTSCTGAAPCTAVFEFSATGSLATATESAVGVSSLTPNPLYEGALDGNYLASANGTGNLYVCGNTAGPPIIYQIPISAGVMGTVVPGPVLANATTACSPVIDIANPNATGGATEWFFASATATGLGNNCASGGCLTNFKSQQWKASTAYAVGQQVLDTHFQIQTVRVAGTSKATVPAWSQTLGATTNDGTALKWLNQGPQAAAHATWLASHAYTLNTIIIDSNSNIELCITAGTSRTAAQGHPTWSLLVDGTTVDGTAHWRNVGAAATASYAAAGGTSGIIIDNVVGSGTLAGASQVYFTTQSNQTCATSGGTGGCAVQASQSALQ